MTLSILFLGLLFGVQHAFEADHIAAVTSLGRGDLSPLQLVRNAGGWGVGHGLTLFTLLLAIYLFGFTLPKSVEPVLEIFVGLLLCYMGAQVLRHAWKKKIQFHNHSHPDGTNHIHAFLDERPLADATLLAHRHPRTLPLRSMLIGMLHGAAGSATLLLLTTATVVAPTTGVLYVAVFSAGNLIGMILVSSLIAIPLKYLAKNSVHLLLYVTRAIGLVTSGIGAILICRNGVLLF